MSTKKAVSQEEKPQFDYFIDCTTQILNPRDQKPVPVDAEGKEFVTRGFVLGTNLSEEKSDHFKPMKAWILAQKFYQTKKVGLDADDFDKVKKTLENSTRWFPFVIGQVMEYLEGLKRE